MKKSILKYGASAIIWLVFTLSASAGPVDPPEGDDPPHEGYAPIDSWELILVMAAIILGIYFLVNHRKKAGI